MMATLAKRFIAESSCTVMMFKAGCSEDHGARAQHGRQTAPVAPSHADDGKVIATENDSQY
jgi:hypothetical protein